jgi:hypothetical protein
MRMAVAGWIVLALVALLAVSLTLTSIQARADAGGWATPTPLPTWTSIPTIPVILIPDETAYPYPLEKGFAFIETPTPTAVFSPAGAGTTGGIPLLCWPLALGVVLIIALGTLIVLQDRGVMPYG